MKLGTDHHIPKSACLSCGEPLEGATCVGHDSAPAVGDVTICIYCGHLMAFDTDLKLRELSDEQVREMAGDGRILAVQRARRLAEKSKRDA
jgi:hypothetical protein